MVRWGTILEKMRYHRHTSRESKYFYLKKNKKKKHTRSICGRCSQSPRVTFKCISERKWRTEKLQHKHLRKNQETASRVDTIILPGYTHLTSLQIRKSRTTTKKIPTNGQLLPFLSFFTGSSFKLLRACAHWDHFLLYWQNCVRKKNCVCAARIKTETAK